MRPPACPAPEPSDKTESAQVISYRYNIANGTNYSYTARRTASRSRTEPGNLSHDGGSQYLPDDVRLLQRAREVRCRAPLPSGYGRGIQEIGRVLCNTSGRTASLFRKVRLASHAG